MWSRPSAVALCVTMVAPNLLCSSATITKALRAEPRPVQGRLERNELGLHKHDADGAEDDVREEDGNEHSDAVRHAARAFGLARRH